MLTEIHLFYMAHILQAIHDWLIRGQGGWTTRWQTRVSEKRLAWWRSGIRQWTRDLWWARNTGCRRTWWNLFHWADVIHVNSCSTFLEMYICIHLERWINKLTVILQNCLSPNVEHDGHLGRRKILRCAEYYQTFFEQPEWMLREIINYGHRNTRRLSATDWKPIFKMVNHKHRKDGSLQAFLNKSFSYFNHSGTTQIIGLGLGGWQWMKRYDFILPKVDVSPTIKNSLESL